MKKLFIAVVILLLSTNVYAKSVEDVLNNAMDENTWGLTTIDYEHHEIHEGDSYITSDVNDVASGGWMSYLIKTPNSTKWAHCLVSIQSEGESEFRICENPTVTANGTAMSLINRDRNSSNTATTAVYKIPSCTASGDTVIIDHWGGTAKAGVAQSGLSRARGEFILKQNEDYLVYISNQAGGANQTAIHVELYEHINK